MRVRFYRSLALLLLLSFCTFSLAAQAVSTEELVRELMTILELLKTTQNEYETVSTELEATQAELATLRNEDLPRLTKRLTDLRASFSDYEKTVSNEIQELTVGLYVTGGSAVVAIIVALITLIT